MIGVSNSMFRRCTVMQEDEMKVDVSRMKTHRKRSIFMLVTVMLCCIFAGMVSAQGLNIPAKRWGIGFGNSKEFTGIRFNFQDDGVRRVTGINVTFWKPKQNNPQSVINGLSIGPMPGGGTLNGVQLGLLGVGAERSANGISLGILGVGAGEDLNGINIGGLGCGSGGDVWGLNIGGLGVGAGGDLKGITIGGLGAGAGGSMAGLNIGLMGVGAGGDLSGVTFGGLGAGAGGSVTGLSIALLGVGAGANLTGVTISGLGAGAGHVLRGLTLCGLAAGAPRVRGITITGGAAGGMDIRGVTLTLGTILVQDDRGGSKALFSGFGFSAFNYIRGTQRGVTIGIVNYAYNLKGIQIGLVNIVRDGPGPTFLPLINARF